MGIGVVYRKGTSTMINQKSTFRQLGVVRVFQWFWQFFFFWILWKFFLDVTYRSGFRWFRFQRLKKFLNISIHTKYLYINSSLIYFLEQYLNFSKVIGGKENWKKCNFTTIYTSNHFHNFWQLWAVIQNSKCSLKRDFNLNNPCYLVIF